MYCLMYKHLTREQRYAIYLGKQKHETNKAIAQAINVSESTVCRELKRHATKNGKYLWIQADENATRKKHRAPGNRAVRPEVRWRVEQLIKDEQWSPKQISGFLAKEGIHISHETIYRFIREDETGELARNCRHKMKVGAR